MTQLDLCKHRIVSRMQWIARALDGFTQSGITDAEWTALQAKADFIFGTRWPFGVHHKDLLR